MVSNSCRPLKVGLPSLGTGKKATRSIKECVKGKSRKLGHTEFGHERKIFLNWNETKRERGAMENECQVKEIQAKSLFRFQLELRKEGMEGSPMTEQE